MRAELDLVSYDRLFPAQDFMPKGSFGNLIALPLHGECRKRGTTVFIDPATLEPFEDQWTFLSTLRPLPAQSAIELAAALGDLATGPDASTYRRPTNGSAGPKPPPKIYARSEAMLAVDRISMPPAILAALKHLASLHNPEFYEKERLRFSTWNTPRFIRSYRETLDRLLLPRGLRDKAHGIVADAGERIGDHRWMCEPAQVDQLRPGARRTSVPAQRWSDAGDGPGPWRRAIRRIRSVPSHAHTRTLRLPSRARPSSAPT